MIVIMTKLEVVETLRKIATSQGCHLSLRVAFSIADWLKGNAVHSEDGTPVRQGETR